jgi:hypothetical protein
VEASFVKKGLVEHDHDCGFEVVVDRVGEGG